MNGSRLLLSTALLLVGGPAFAGQQVEIEGMRRRMAQLLRGGSMQEPDGFPALGGTRSAPR